MQNTECDAALSTMANTHTLKKRNKERKTHNCLNSEECIHQEKKKQI